MEDELFDALYNEFVNQAQMGDFESANNIYEQLLQSNTIPIYEKTNEGLTAKNLPKLFRSENSRTIYKDKIIMMGLSCKSSDISFDENDTVTIKLCQCNRSSDQRRDNQIASCKNNCASVAVTVAGAVCYNMPRPCTVICVSAVEALRRACDWCCEGEGFHDRCIKPLENFRAPECHYPRD